MTLRDRSQGVETRAEARHRGIQLANNVGSRPGVGDKINARFIGAIVAVATIGGFMFGYDSGVINGTQQGLERTFNLSKLGTGLNVGAILLGCAVGAFIAGRLADVIGRRSVMIIAALLFIVSALAAGAADTS